MVVRQYKAKGEVTSTLLPVVALDDIKQLIFDLNNSWDFSQIHFPTVCL